MSDDDGTLYSRNLCRSCGHTMHEVRATEREQGRSAPDDKGFRHELNTSYQIIRCCGCGSFSFADSIAVNKISSLNVRTQVSVKRRLWPPRLEGVKALRDEDVLPEGVGRVLKETREAMASNLPTLAAIGFRTLVEAVAKNKGVKANNLKQLIDGLVGIGVLTQQNAAALHDVRVFGNAAAHELKPGTEAELDTVLRIVNHLLEDVYIMRKLTTPKRKKVNKKPKK